MPTVYCPGCGQPLSLDPDTPGKVECGGVGNGICAVAVYAVDVGRDPAAALCEWVYFRCGEPVPTADLCDAVRMAFVAV